MRDYALGTTFDVKFTTRRFSSGATFTLAGSPVISAYPDNSVTQLTAGITLTVDFDGVTGLNNVRVVATSGNGYASGSNYALVITTGTVDGVSVTGEVVGEFSLEAQSPLRATTAGRTLDVSAGGEAGLDWANVGSPTTTLALTGTTIATTQKVDIETIKTNPVANGGTVTFPTNSTLASTTNITAGTVTTATNVTTVNGLAANVITATSIAADAITAAKIADNAIDRATFAADTGHQSLRSNTAQAGAATSITLDASANANNSFYVNDLIILTGGTGAGQARFITAYNGTTKVATVTAWTTNPDNTTTFAIMGFDAIVGATAPTAAQNATAVWTDLLAGSDFSTSSSIGKLLKDDIDAQITSRMATYTQPTGFLAATFPATVASTTNITTAALGASERSAIADALLDRDMATGTDSGSSSVRTVRQALRFLRNKWAISGTTLTVYKEDDSTTTWTSTLATTPGADPVTSTDPAGP